MEINVKNKSIYIQTIVNENIFLIKKNIVLYRHQENNFILNVQYLDIVNYSAFHTPLNEETKWKIQLFKLIIENKRCDKDNGSVVFNRNTDAYFLCVAVHIMVLFKNQWGECCSCQYACMQVYILTLEQTPNFKMQTKMQNRCNMTSSQFKRVKHLSFIFKQIYIYEKKKYRHFILWRFYKVNKKLYEMNTVKPSVFVVFL